MKKNILLAIATILASNVAFAHPGHGLANGFASGFMHPLLGWDHLLMMLAVGVWAANIGGKARWQLPLTFVATMLLGAIIGAAGITFGAVESIIAAGLIALGLALMSTFTVLPIMQFAVTGLFALMHGLAHGVELGQNANSSLVLPLVGMVLCTTLLHVLGYGIGLQKHRFLALLQPLLAGLMLGLGANLLLSV